MDYLIRLIPAPIFLFIFIIGFIGMIKHIVTNKNNMDEYSLKGLKWSLLMFGGFIMVSIHMCIEEGYLKVSDNLEIGVLISGYIIGIVGFAGMVKYAKPKLKEKPQLRNNIRIALKILKVCLAIVIIVFLIALLGYFLEG